MPRKFLRSLRRRRRSRRRSSKKKTTNRQKSKKMRGGVTVRAQDLKTRLPEDMFGEIREMHPLLTPKLTNATIKRAVRDYLIGGARKQRVVTKYGDISNWDVSNVTNMEEVFCGENFEGVTVEGVTSFYLRRKRLCTATSGPTWHSERSMRTGSV